MRQVHVALYFTVRAVVIIATLSTDSVVPPCGYHRPV